MNKLTSRKFIVWIATFIIAIVSFIITKTVSPEIVNMYLVVSAAYLGANSFVAFVRGKDDTTRKNN